MPQSKTKSSLKPSDLKVIAVAEQLRNAVTEDRIGHTAKHVQILVNTVSRAQEELDGGAKDRTKIIKSATEFGARIAFGIGGQKDERDYRFDQKLTNTARLLLEDTSLAIDAIDGYIAVRVKLGPTGIAAEYEDAENVMLDAMKAEPSGTSKPKRPLTEKLMKAVKDDQKVIAATATIIDLFDYCLPAAKEFAKQYPHRRPNSHILLAAISWNELHSPTGVLSEAKTARVREYIANSHPNAIKALLKYVPENAEYKKGQEIIMQVLAPKPRIALRK